MFFFVFRNKKACFTYKITKPTHLKSITLLLTLCLSVSVTAQQADPPSAQKIQHQTIIHGDTLNDDYFWLRDKYSPEVINYLYANNAYADNMMKSSATLRKVLFDEFRSRIKETYTSKPQKRKNFFYYTKTVADKEYPMSYRKRDSLNAPEQLVLDMNELAKEFMYFSLQMANYSPDQSLLAYGVDNKGHNMSTLFIKDIDKDTVYRDEKIDSVLSLVWMNDNKTFFYVKAEPKTKRGYRVYKHILGNAPSTDILVFEEPDKTFEIGLGRSASEKFIIMGVSKTRSSESWFWSADDTNAKPQLFLKRQPELSYDLNHYSGDEFYIQTNLNAKNRQLMKASLNAKSTKEWSPVIPHRKGVLFLGYTMFKDYLIWEETQHASQRVLIKNRNTGVVDTINPQMEHYSISYNVEDYHYEHTTAIRYTVSNAITPGITYNYLLKEKTATVYEKDTLPGKPYDPEKYVVEKVWAKAPDGVLVPMMLSYKKGLVKNGNNPLFLNGYGSYGSSLYPDFSIINISYLDRGFIVATAHVRGGREMGEEWYDDGRMLNKKNTFTDFIACAEHLIKEKYTKPSRLAISGGSAGGLLMGAVVNMRPDLFKCVVADVPFVDVMNTMLDETIPLTTFEFDEWGNPKVKKYYDYMLSYSPYDNVKPTAYPDMLVTAGYNDAQVGYWEPAKWVSKIREFKTDTNMLLFKTEMEGGHGGASGRYNQLSDIAFSMAFIMKSLGVRENYVSIKGKVIDENNEPVSYANVYIDETKTGTTTNAEGEFEIKLKEFSNATLVVQSITYQKQKIKLGIKSRITGLVIKLKSEYVQLKTVNIVASATDPALGIIKQAINKRKENNNRVQSFAADVYMKSTVRLNEIPKEMPAFLKLLANGETIDSNDIGLVYLSESVAKYYHAKPDNTKEQMLASKVAGEKQGFSWNRVGDAFFNLYETTISLPYYSERPFVSPIAPLATLSYRYKFRGSFYVEKKEINKIEVIPQRKGDPLFKGFIYITSDDYQIFGSDLFITKDAQIQFVDTVHLKQEMINIEDTWVPLQTKVSSHIKVFGFRATDMSVAAIGDYQLNKKFPPKFFGNELFSIDKNANKKDSNYWTSNRIVVLTDEEASHYSKADSISKAKNSPQYLDSMARRQNKITIGKILVSGYNYSRVSDTLYKSLSFDPLLTAFGYNTVEGLYTNYTIRFTKSSRDEDEAFWSGNRSSFSATFRYGFINKNWALGGTYYKTIDARTRTNISLKGGRFVEQFNHSEPINNIINAGYTLFDRLNYMKLLQKDLASVTLTRELLNGVYVKGGIAFHQREAMVNHADFSFANKNKRAFTSNNPLNPLNDAPAFRIHQTFEYDIALRYVIDQKYESYPGYKMVVGSAYPDLYFNYRQGVAISNYNFNYQYIEAGTGKDIELKLLGLFSFDVTAGLFLSASGMQFADFKHFNGNQTLFLHNPRNVNVAGSETRTRLTGFHALSYYGFSTNDKFLEVHARQNFRGFWLGKLPLLRMLKAHENVGINFVSTPVITYNELYLGLSNLLTAFRIDAGRVTSSGADNNWFIRLGVAF